MGRILTTLVRASNPAGTRLVSRYCLGLFCVPRWFSGSKLGLQRHCFSWRYFWLADWLRHLWPSDFPKPPEENPRANLLRHARVLNANRYQLPRELLPRWNPA